MTLMLPGGKHSEPIESSWRKSLQKDGKATRWASSPTLFDVFAPTGVMYPKKSFLHTLGEARGPFLSCVSVCSMPKSANQFSTGLPRGFASFELTPGPAGQG